MLAMNWEEKFGKEGLTFDDVLLLPGESDVLPRGRSSNETHQTHYTEHTINEFGDGYRHRGALGYRFGSQGGMGVIHRNLTIEEQALEVEQGETFGKRYHRRSGVSFSCHSIRDALAIMERYHISGVPITEEDGLLVGILTNRDLVFEETSINP